MSVLLLGRDPSCGLVLDSPLVSRFHAKLEGGRLIDLDSANGTFVDGFDLTAASGTITVNPCQRDTSPLATVTGPGPILVALLQGAMPLPAAIARGVQVAGDAGALTRVLPPPPPASTNVPGQYN